jgi:Transcriptional Coactivator p15 (PC4)
MRFVSVNEFKKKKYVNIREYYNDAEGQMKPGKRGMRKLPLLVNFVTFLLVLTSSISGVVKLLLLLKMLLMFSPNSL